MFQHVSTCFNMFHHVSTKVMIRISQASTASVIFKSLTGSISFPCFTLFLVPSKVMIPMPIWAPWHHRKSHRQNFTAAKSFTRQVRRSRSKPPACAELSSAVGPAVGPAVCPGESTNHHHELSSVIISVFRVLTARSGFNMWKGQISMGDFLTFMIVLYWASTIPGPLTARWALGQLDPESAAVSGIQSDNGKVRKVVPKFESLPWFCWFILIMFYVYIYIYWFMMLTTNEMS